MLELGYDIQWKNCLLHDEIRDSLQFLFSWNGIYDLWYEAHVWMDMGQHALVYRGKDVCCFNLFVCLFCFCFLF